MAELERFGNYLLLKKLGEDALGESFRAGRVSGEELEEVVLLRVFNGQGISGEGLAQAMRQREDLGEELPTGAAVPAVDIGSVAGTPYAAWDYVAGRPLNSVLELGAKEQMPLPMDHALLIAERLSLTAASAEETRHGGQRLLHGFLVPPLITLSAEGEVQLTGFEVGPGLRQLAADGGSLAEAYGAYLSPEARRGEPSDRADACWSLAAILLEMLTGTPPDAQTPELQGLVAATDGSALPPQLVDLMARSLTVRENRVTDAAAWHRELTKILGEGDFSPTTFNLAFYMHSLLRESLEQEAASLGAEKEAGREALAMSTEPEENELGAVEATERAPDELFAASAARPRRRGIWIGAAAVVAAAVLVGGWWFMRQQPTEVAQASSPADAASTGRGGLGQSGGNVGSPSAALPATGPELAAQEEEAAAAADELAALEERMMGMLDARTREMSADIQQQYQEQLDALQQQLADARTTAAERQKALEAARERAAAQPALAAAASQDDLTAEAERLPAVAEAEGEISGSTGAVETAALPTATPVGVDSTQVGSGAASTVPESAAAAQQSRAQKPPTPRQSAPPQEVTQEARRGNRGKEEPAETSAESEPQIKPGTLVELGPGVRPPVMVNQPEPSYPPIARRMGREATVRLRVLVNERGGVERVERLGPEVGLGFDQEAMEAARNSEWRPATKDGVAVKVWVPLSIRFQL